MGSWGWGTPREGTLTIPAVPAEYEWVFFPDDDGWEGDGNGNLDKWNDALGEALSEGDAILVGGPWTTHGGTKCCYYGSGTNTFSAITLVYNNNGASVYPHRAQYFHYSTAGGADWNLASDASAHPTYLDPPSPSNGWGPAIINPTYESTEPYLTILGEDGKKWSWWNTIDLAGTDVWRYPWNNGAISGWHYPDGRIHQIPIDTIYDYGIDWGDEGDAYPGDDDGVTGFWVYTEISPYIPEIPGTGAGGNVWFMMNELESYNKEV